jgi:predicted permease
VVSELALSLVLLVGAGLMIRSFTRLVQVRPGFRPEGVLTMSAVLAGDRYGQPEQRIQFLDAVTARIATLPGVTAVAAANNVPFSGGMNGGVQVEGRTLEGADVPNAEKRIVTDGYFGTMGIPVRQGRTFGPADRLDGPKVVVISETMARRLWPNESAVGRRIRSLTCGDDCWEEVVGVVGDVREAALDQAAAMEVYYPATQAPPSGFVLLARAADDPASLITPIRQAVAQIDGLQPVYNVQTLSQIVSASVADRRLATLLLSAFAGVALVLAAIGIGGVISYAVSQRTREIGLRIALGSRPQEVTRLVVGQGVRLAALGLGFGVPAALALSRFLRTQLYGVAPTHPLAYALAAAAVVGVAIAASWIPAWRATRVSPMEALRHE